MDPNSLRIRVKPEGNKLNGSSPSTKRFKCKECGLVAYFGSSKYATSSKLKSYDVDAMWTCN